MDLFSKLFGRKPDDVNVTEETEVKPNKPSASEAKAILPLISPFSPEKISNL